MKVKAKATAVLACCWSIAVLSFSPLAHAAADPHVLTQTCPNGDKIALNMNKKILTFTHGSQTYHATYDDGYAIPWAADNPPLPDGVKTMPTGGQIGTHGAFLGDRDVDNNVVCSRDKYLEAIMWPTILMSLRA
jgi:hypothetical protein